MSAPQNDTRTTITVTVKVWRQDRGAKKGRFVEYDAVDIPIEASFLEMLDILNETLVENNEDPIAFESDCREGICGTCGVFSIRSTATKLPISRSIAAGVYKTAVFTVFYLDFC